MVKLSSGLRNARSIVVAIVVLAIVGGGAYYFFDSGPADKTVTATFNEAVGIYPGTPVKILGVNVGTVDDVKPQGNGVQVKMSYDPQYKLPANVQSLEVANSLVSDRYIQLQPVYRSGATMANGGTIATKNTAGPAELDDIYSSLNTLSAALGPKGANKDGALSTLLKVSSANLKGNGAALGNSITQLSKAASTLANGRGDLFQTVANLRRFTGALKSSDSQVRLFNTQLAQVAGDLAGERTDLGAALHDLGIALDNVNSFVKGNASKLHTTITGLRTLTQVLVNEKGSLEETLSIAPVALANIVHAYAPSTGSLATRSNLSSLTDPAQVCGLVNISVLKGLLPLASVTNALKTTCTTILSTPGASLLSGVLTIFGGTLPVSSIGTVLGGGGLGLLTGGLTGTVTGATAK